MNTLSYNPDVSDHPDFDEPNTTESRRKHVRFWLRCLADRGEQPDARIHVALDQASFTLMRMPSGGPRLLRSSAIANPLHASKCEAPHILATPGHCPVGTIRA